MVFEQQLIVVARWKYGFKANSLSTSFFFWDFVLEFDGFLFCWSCLFSIYIDIAFGLCSENVLLGSGIFGFVYVLNGEWIEIGG